MSTLTKHQIVKYLKRGELLLNPCKKENGEFDVEPASYDLRAGTIIWKETNRNTNETYPKSKTYDPEISHLQQEKVTLQPGQVMFVITHEEVVMPNDLCGTVYAKNKFSREGILALTTGHVDPGVQCPIVIRLINLRSIPYTFQLGEPIYSIVFHKLEIESGQKLETHHAISMELTYKRTIEAANNALGNALNDLSLTNDFVKKEDFGTHFFAMIKSNIYRLVAWTVGVFLTLAAVVGGWHTVVAWISGWFTE